MLSDVKDFFLTNFGQKFAEIVYLPCYYVDLHHAAVGSAQVV